jgi:hypothetical protein
MNDKVIIALATMAIIAGCYIVYMTIGEGGDGAIFATVIGTIAGIGGALLGLKIEIPGKISELTPTTNTENGDMNHASN